MDNKFEVKRGSDDPYADSHESDAALKALKARAMTDIIKVLRVRQLSNVDASEIVGVHQQELSRIRNGQLRGITIETLRDILESLIHKGQDRAGKIALMQSFITDAVASGISQRSMDDIITEARALAGVTKISK